MIGFEELEARRQARAHRRRRRIRRRRTVALLALVGGAAVVVLAATGSGTTHPRATRGHDVTDAATRRASRGPLPSSAGDPAHVAVPILMYHVIRPAPPGAEFPALYVPPHEFAAQMRALEARGWTAVTLDEVWNAWTRAAALPPGRPIVISFDNGYESQFNAAMPVLRRLHWTGVMNLQLSGLPRSQGGLSAQALRRMLAAGWELDTQGFTHADLVRLGPAQLRHEVATARRVLQRRWHVPVHWFCYPSGHYDARVVAAVSAAGYRGSSTVVPGWTRRTTDPFRLPRLRVVAGTSPEALQQQISAARHRAAPPPTYGAA